MRNPFNNQQGIRSIMENQNALSGILGVIGQVLQVENGYEEAVSTALGAAMNHIVTVDEQAARDAIRFLNRNQSGRATFLPLTVCTPRYVSQDNQIICQNTKGYLGVAADFVKNNDQFEPVITSLLNNVLVVEDMEAGNELSTLTKRLYKIVTLSGEVIHRGGSMTGGKTRHDTNIMTMRKEAEEINALIDAESARVELATKALNQANEARDKAAQAMSEKRYAVAALEPVVDAKKAKLEKLKNDLALLDPKGLSHDSDDSHTEELIVRLNQAYLERDTITNDMKAKREQRYQINQEAERREQQTRQMRKELSTAEASANAIKVDQ